MSKPVEPAAVRELAYRLWVGRGRPEGDAQQDWFEAERRLSVEQRRADSKAVDEAGKESFPASDTPASGLPDKPPANADAKWAAAGKTRKRRVKNGAAADVPAVPESKRAPGAEIPKVGSRDAPGG